MPSVLASSMGGPWRHSKPCFSGGRGRGQFLNIQVFHFLPDPGAFNSCMHTFPENNAGSTMVYNMILRIWIWDLRPSIWNFANRNHEDWPYARGRILRAPGPRVALLRMMFLLYLRVLHCYISVFCCFSGPRVTSLFACFLKINIKIHKTKKEPYK